MLNNQDAMAGPNSKALALGTILIVEDEPMLALMLEELVRELGASDVLVVGEPIGARQAAETAAIDCAILDVHLGGETSFAVADALAARDIPFIFSSAGVALEVEERHRHRPLLGKPFADDELRAHLLGLLTR